MQFVRVDEHHDALTSDFPWLASHVLIVRERALENLRGILESNGELLPLNTNDGTNLWAYNARVVNALDEARSSLQKFSGTNRIMRIRKVAFIKDAIIGVDVFRLPYQASATYVSERFIERIKKAELVGLDFKEVWSA